LCPKCHKKLEKDKSNYWRCYDCGGMFTNADSLIKEKQYKASQFTKSVKKPFKLSQFQSVVVMAALIAFIGVNLVIFNSFNQKTTIQSRASEVKNNLRIPVLGNGDITSAQIAVQKLKNLDGIMIGRASLRNPWIFAQCRALFEGKTIPPKPSLADQLDFFRHHAQLSVQFKNETWAMMELRKHFAHFVRGIRGASQFRDRLMRIKSMAEMEEIFEEIEK